MLVDDDYLNAMRIARALEDLGIDVIVVKGAEEALAALGKGEPCRLIVTDVVMPLPDIFGRPITEEMTGIELTRWIQKRYMIPVVGQSIDN